MMMKRSQTKKNQKVKIAKIKTCRQQISEGNTSKILMNRLHMKFRFQAGRYQGLQARWICNIKPNSSIKINSFSWKSNYTIMGSKISRINTFCKTVHKICLCKFKTESTKFSKRLYRIRSYNWTISKYSSFNISK